MLIVITDKCGMGCSHCLSDCKPSGTDMKPELMDKIIPYVDSVGSHVVLITGGEPTEHPQLFDILDRIYATDWKKRKALSIITNGIFLNKENSKEVCDRLLSYEKLNIQITSDARFYPTPLDAKGVKYLCKKGRDRVLVERSLTILTDAHGRALNAKLPAMRRRDSPFCFNWRSLARSGFSVQEAMFNRESAAKFCSFSVDMHGNVRISESLLCAPVGTIDMPLDDLATNIRKMTCSGCILAKNLTGKYRQAIGI